MPSINFIGGEKGGVGKSVTARALAQYFIDKGVPFTGFDTDRFETSQNTARPPNRGSARERSRSHAKPEPEATKNVQEKSPEILNQGALAAAPVTRHQGRKKEVAALLLPRRSVPVE